MFVGIVTRGYTHVHAENFLHRHVCMYSSTETHACEPTQVYPPMAKYRPYNILRSRIMKPHIFTLSCQCWEAHCQGHKWQTTEQPSFFFPFVNPGSDKN